jgi:hypothetical protein
MWQAEERAALESRAPGTPDAALIRFTVIAS